MDMSDIWKKKAKKLNLPPGSLVDIGDLSAQKTRISLINYDEESIQQRAHVTIETCFNYLKKPSITWINVWGMHDAKLIGDFGRTLGLHPLMLEDIMITDQRSKLDDYKDTLFIIMRMLNYSKKEEEEMLDEQISLILGKNYVVSFTERKEEVFKPVLQRLKMPHSQLRKRGADFLCYSLVDCVVDHCHVILDHMDEQLDNLEDELIYEISPKTLQKIQHQKREISSLRKAVWPLREVVNRFQRIDTPLVQETTKLYLQDVYDHTIQAIDTVESFRDISAGLLDMYMSTMSQKMNEVMKVLTLVSTIFVPLTFVASIYGMNFKHMPELDWGDGYYATLGFMACIAVGMLVFFKRKDWI